MLQRLIPVALYVSSITALQWVLEFIALSSLEALEVERGERADERKALGRKNGVGGTFHEHISSSLLRTLQIENIHPLQPPLEV